MLQNFQNKLHTDDEKAGAMQTSGRRGASRIFAADLTDVVQAISGGKGRRRLDSGICLKMIKLWLALPKVVCDGIVGSSQSSMAIGCSAFA
uniref:Uncharacterized protein n=2 Tax=Leersia perrieri TaxID=77586 RepID=A0A0D9WHY4_9ORYZ